MSWSGDEDGSWLFEAAESHLLRVDFVLNVTTVKGENDYFAGPPIWPVVWVKKCDLLF